MPAVPSSYRTSGCGSYEVEVPYTATITLPTGERFQDSGWAYTYAFGFNRVEFCSAPGTVTTPAPPALPTDKAQCKDGGWKAFPRFKNQGDCVSFVAMREQHIDTAFAFDEHFAEQGFQVLD